MSQPATTRTQRVAKAQRLRAEGLKLREIAERMGVATQTVHTWLSDPDLAYQRARRARYAAPCEFCGCPTDGSGGYKSQRRVCIDCVTWSREAIVDAIKRWADEHGGIPPTCGDWRHAADAYPSSRTVCRRFNWNGLLIDAGFALRCDRRPETQAWVEQQVAAGRSFVEIGNEFGVTAQAIHLRLKNRGLTPELLREQVPA